MEDLGITEPEEQVYRWLLKHRNATTTEVARALSFVSSKAQRLLDTLGAKGLATHTPERPRRYIPASPDVALSFLVTERQKRLENVQTVIKELQSEAALERQEEHEQVVELITSQEAERQTFQQLVQLARHELLGLDKPPLRGSKLDVPAEEDHPDQRAAQRRGVRIRSIVDAEFMALPGAVSGIREDARAGENYRVFPELPSQIQR